MSGMSGDILEGCWYVAMTSADLKAGCMANLRLASIPIVVSRTRKGAIFALRDTCPHRGVPLHYGRVVEDGVACAYHGWRFDSSGICTEIPSLPEGQRVDLSKIRCPTYSVLERYGLIWIYLPHADESPGAGAASEPLSLPSVAFDMRPQVGLVLEFPSTIEHSVLALTDLTHAPFVHNLWWFKKEPTKPRPKQKVFEPAPFGFRMKRHDVPSQNILHLRLFGKGATTEITYVLPGYRIEHILGDGRWLVALTAHVPLDNETTLVWQFFWSSLRWISPFSPLIRRLARIFLVQDRRYVVLQREGLRSNPRLMLLNDGDTPARWWLRLRDEWKQAQMEKRPFRNPLKEQTLRWRS
jgi:phenylpropionate dioxygenase-like ring-hydroxylating dioxygenase large terminal subunit